MTALNPAGSDEARSTFLARNPALSWRCLPFGYVVRDPLTHSAIALDALGSAVFHHLSRPAAEADLETDFAGEPGFRSTLGVLLDHHVLVHPDDPPVHITRDEPASGGKQLFDEVMLKGYHRASLPYAAGIEWTSGNHRHTSRPDPFESYRNPLLSTRVWRQVLEDLAALGTLELLVAGPDPLLRGDALLLLRAARRAGFAVTLFTEGDPVSEPMADALAELALDGIWITLYAPHATVHDRVAGRPGSFERTARGIRALTRRGAPVHINGLPSMAGDAHRASLDALAQELNCPVVIDPFRLPGDGREPTENAAGHHPSVYVTSDGTVTPCRAHPLTIGSIVRHRLPQLWQGSAEMQSLATLPLVPRAGCRECAIRTTCFIPSQA